MTSSTPGSSRGGLRVARLLLRIVLIVAFIALLGLNVARRGPELVAAFSPSSPSPSLTTAAGPSTSSAPSISAAPSASASPSVSDSAPTTGAGTTSGAGGGGSGTSGGGTTHVQPTSNPKPKSNLVITSFSAENVQCPQPSGGQFTSNAPNPSVIPEWNSTGATKAWFGIDTSNAKANPYEAVPTNGALQFTWPCPSATQEYAFTIEDAAGNDLTRTIVVHNTGYKG